MSEVKKLDSLQQALEKKCERIAEERVNKLFFPIFDDNLVLSALSEYILLPFKDVDGKEQENVTLRACCFNGSHLRALITKAILPTIIADETRVFLTKVESLMDGLQDHTNRDDEEGYPF